MQKQKVLITHLNKESNLPLPEYATELSSGLDLIADIVNPIIIKPQDRAFVPTGIAIAMPKGMEAQVRSRSGLAAKKGIFVLNSPGTIDADYRGEIKVILYNSGKEDFVIERGMKIAQIVFAPVLFIEWEEVSSLDETARGVGGFGSTGV